MMTILLADWIVHKIAAHIDPFGGKAIVLTTHGDPGIVIMTDIPFDVDVRPAVHIDPSIGSYIGHAVKHGE